MGSVRGCRRRLCARIDPGTLAACAARRRVPGVVCVGISGRLVACRSADMGGDEFATAVVTAVNHALPNGFKTDSRFVIVHGGAADSMATAGRKKK